jgi:L-fuculose-phosphate aldolase
MTMEEGMQQLLGAHQFFDKEGAGYTSWGKVSVLQIALRISDTEFLMTNVDKTVAQIIKDDIHVVSKQDHLFQQIFSKRKKINVILITQQQYAAQVKEEIPAILDDQAQLLGVSIRVVNPRELAQGLQGRFATVLTDGKSVCIGSSIDDAYVAAQLLEKTSKVFLEAKYLGGAKPINKIEAWFMQQYYQLKYSKEAVKNK